MRYDMTNPSGTVARTFRGYERKPGPWHSLPARTDGYGYPLPSTALCGVSTSAARIRREEVRDRPDLAGTRCAKCAKIARAALTEGTESA